MKNGGGQVLKKVRIGCLILMMVLIFNLFATNVSFAKSSNFDEIAKQVNEYFLSQPYEYYSSTAESYVGDNARIVEYENKIYCFGSDSTLIYDIYSDSWETAPAMPYSRDKYGIAAVNGNIYIIGGINGSQVTNHVDVFGVSDMSWGSTENLPYAIYDFDAVVVNNIIYCAGGYTKSTLDMKMQWFDTLSGTWTIGKSVPKQAFYTAAAHENSIYYTMTKSKASKTLVYDTLNNKWHHGQTRPYYNIDGVKSENGKLFNLSEDFMLYTIIDNQNYANYNVKYVYLPEKNTWAAVPNIAGITLDKYKILVYNNRIFSLEEQTQGNGNKKSVLKIVYIHKDSNIYGNEILAVGDRHILTVKDGVLMAKGNNTYGQLGNGTTTESDLFVEVKAPWKEKNETVRMVATGSNSSYVVTDKNNLYAWGINTKGELGNGANKNIAVPELVESNVAYVSAGKEHTVIIKQDGSMWTSGSNQYGQLGDSTSGYRTIFKKILNINDAKAVETGDYQTFFVDKNSVLYSCGKNDMGQLGLGNNEASVSQFSQVEENIKEVSAGFNHVLALTNQGTVYSWGSNAYQQLGATGIESRNTPELINGISGVDTVKAGGNTSAYLIDGIVYKWGRGSTDSTSQPQSANGISNIDSFDIGGDIIAALDSSGNMWQWGISTYAQELLDKNQTNTPVKMQWMNDLCDSGIYGLVARRHQVLVEKNGYLYAWGTGYFSTGGSSEEIYGYPKGIMYKNGEQVYYSSNICRGKNFNVYTMADESNTGTVCGWGGNTDRVMGEQGGKVKWATEIPGFSNNWYEDGDGDYWLCEDTCLLAAGDGFMVADVHDVSENGPSSVNHYNDLYTIGKNNVGQLGDGTTNSSSEPIQIMSGKFECLAAGDDFTIAVKEYDEEEGSEIYAWGGNKYGQLGLGHTENMSTPTPVTGVFPSGSTEHFVDIKCGPDFCIGLTSEGNVYSWGKNSAGQLGLGNKNNVYTPTKITALSNVKSIGAGYNHAMAIKEDGTLWTWGYSSDGQLGRNTSNASSPRQVSGLPEMEEVSGGYGFSVACDVDGNIWSFGSNANGGLGIYAEMPFEVYYGLGKRPNPNVYSMRSSYTNLNVHDGYTYETVDGFIRRRKNV